MNRYIIYDPQDDTYVKMEARGWTSGHPAEAVNSYGSLESAREAIRPFDSLKHCVVTEVQKIVHIIKQHI